VSRSYLAEVIALAKARGNTVTNARVGRRFKIPPAHVCVLLRRYRALGYLEHVAIGKWQLTALAIALPVTPPLIDRAAEMCRLERADITASLMASCLGIPKTRANVLLAKLCLSGVVRRVRCGVYASTSTWRSVA
jgi:predicted transcriptional regulator of viral defense system